MLRPCAASALARASTSKAVSVPSDATALFGPTMIQPPLAVESDLRSDCHDRQALPSADLANTTLPPSPLPRLCAGGMSRSDIATVLILNTVGAVGAQVAPGRVMFEHRAEDHEQRAHAGAERANTRVGQAASTDVGTTGREMLGAHSQHRFRSPHARPSQRLAPIPILPPFPPFRHSCAPPPPPSFLRPPPRHSCAPPPVIPAPPPSFLRRQESTRPPNRATSLHPPLPSFRHSHPSAIPAPPPSFLRRQESMRPPNRATSLHPPFPSFRHSCAPLRHSCAPSVIPAEAGIHATAQPCDEPPSAIPILPPFLRPLRHSCAPFVIPAPPPSFLRPLRHSCAPFRTFLRPLPSFLRPLRHPAPPPSFLRRQESMRPPNRATSLHPPDGPPEPPARRA